MKRQCAASTGISLPLLLGLALLTLGACAGSEEIAPGAPGASSVSEGTEEAASQEQAPAQAAAPAAPVQMPSTISIFRPVGHNADTFASDTLLQVPTGYMFLLALEVSAHHEVLTVYINNELMARPHNTFLELQVPYLLQLGENRITVRADTLTERKEEVFTVRVEPPPASGNPRNR